MLYAQTGIGGVSAVGGCPGHWEKADKNDPHFSVSCREHETFLIQSKDPLWSPNPAQVPLTELEKRQLDEQKARADAVTANMMAQMANQAMAVVAAQGEAAVAAASTPATAPARSRKPRTARTKPATTATV